MKNLNFLKSSFSESLNCVEVAGHDGTVFVRDSKNPDGPGLTFNSAEWEAFTSGVRAAEFDF